MTDRKDALIVFARVPEPGKVKTRLMPTLSPLEASSLYEAFLGDALDRFSSFGVSVRLCLAPSARELSATMIPRDAVLLQQTGHDLGERMAYAFVDTFRQGYERAVIVGTDSPTLPDEFILMAFESLDEPLSAAIGPSEDGGYYLLGTNDFFPALFADMTFSHSRVFDDTMERLSDANRLVTVLPSWYDVDEPADLVRLAEDLNHSDLPLSRTRAAMAKLRHVIEAFAAR